MQQTTHTEKTILRTRGLTKRYGSTLALDDVSIELREHHIYGFIGENGAGKSTLMKIVGGLTFPTSGELELMGETGGTGLDQARRSIGAMIELPAVSPGYTVEKNVELKRVISGNPDKGAVSRVLEMVGLTDAKDRKAGKLSMGMKQRLGIAMALVGNPKLLILDEPINGLDPQNIVALRRLLKKLNEERDITIFISSHILSELYLLATDYIIIHKGKIIETLTHEQLEEKCRKYICVRTDDVPAAVTVLDKLTGSDSYRVTADDTIRIYSGANDTAAISKAFMEQGIVVRELSYKEQTLEDYFITVSQGGHIFSRGDNDFSGGGHNA